MSGSEAVQLEVQLDTIKTALLSLKAAGADGFEGLLRVVLTKLTGIPFRLAASGLQGGMDGDAAMPSDAVSFEAKRYSGTISRESVLTKIVDLARSENAADRLWVLGATSEVSAQLAAAVRQDGDLHAISTFILDWISEPLPFLAVAIVAAESEAVDFLIQNYDEKQQQRRINRKDLAGAFASISKHPEFKNMLQSVQANLNVSSLAFTQAINLNAQWREDTFGSTDRARERLGQALTVAANPDPVMRSELRGRVGTELLNGSDIILSGDEGHGKSWLAAQVCSGSEGMALFVSAEQFDSTTIDDLDEFLIALLIKQSGDVEDETLKVRWRYRLKAWKVTPPHASLLVVIDGINQRQSLRWDRLLNGLQSRLQEIGGRLVVTVRSQFWQNTVAHGLAFTPTVISIPEWTPEERDGLLTHYGITLDWLDDGTLRTLQNPRLLGVAVATLPRHEDIAWKGLTTDRLLMEHLRASQRENFENESFKELTSRLSEHATQVLARVQASSSEPTQHFRVDSAAVVETRFFRALPGPGDFYELRDEGLTLALGFTLVDQLWQTHRAELDLVERVVQLIDPIHAMDRTADVLFASLLVCALDKNIRFDKEIFSVLLDAFANLQNISDQRFEEFVEIVRHQPKVFFEVLKGFCLERGQRINHDWFVHGAFEVAATDLGSPVAEIAIHQWLHCYSKDSIAQANRYPKHDALEYQNRLKKRKDEIDDVLLNLSHYERKLLEQMTEVSGELETLFTLALQLLAGRPLAKFADGFVAMGLAFGLDGDVHSARKAFQQLATFNRVDRAASKDAFVKAIAPLRAPETSRVGQWTVIRMLFATGDKAAVAEADTLAKELRENWPNSEPPSPHAWKQIKVADPKVARPVDMDVGLQRFDALDPDEIWQVMTVTSEDREYRDFLPVACRFAPEIAYRKARSILGGLLTRTGFPLRQVIMNSEGHLPLIGPDLAGQLVKRVSESDVIDTLPEDDQRFCRMLAFYYAVAQLSAKEQLDCITGKSLGPYYLLSVIPSLKPQPTGSIMEALTGVLDMNDESAAHGILIAALHGNTQITPELEALILRCCNGESPELRGVAYELATCRDLEKVRQAHAQSTWTAHSIDNRAYERWFGSVLLVEACAKRELKKTNDLLKRISRETWFFAANRLGAEFAKPLADFFVRSLKMGVNTVSKTSLPSVDLTFSSGEPASLPLISIGETDRVGDRFPKQKSLNEVLGAHDDFDEKQEGLRAVADAFFQELRGSDAQLLVQRITIGDIYWLVEAVPEFVEFLDQVPQAQFIWLRNFAFAAANHISGDSPERAVVLFRRATASQGVATQALGDDLTLEHEAIWASKDSEPIKGLWRQRLQSSGSDATLAREVLAAERFGASAFIKSLVREMALSQDSLDHAYAASIAGYSNQGAELVAIIEKHADDKGLPGEAAKHALISHEAAQWAEHWINQMWDAPTSEEFWRCLMIAKTCMDARVCDQPKLNTKWGCYAPVFQSIRKVAIKEKNKEREKRFIGRETPERIFVATAT